MVHHLVCKLLLHENDSTQTQIVEWHNFAVTTGMLLSSHLNGGWLASENPQIVLLSNAKIPQHWIFAIYLFFGWGFLTLPNDPSRSAFQALFGEQSANSELNTNAARQQ